ncbi:hypothetical protein MNV49_001547 [Pseudohyphozyma bogoriensis]|nr:hypothetical protein MNV49_001547 [Pseudohyphozyma bogoriensis]
MLASIIHFLAPTRPSSSATASTLPASSSSSTSPPRRTHTPRHLIAPLKSLPSTPKLSLVTIPLIRVTPIPDLEHWINSPDSDDDDDDFSDANSEHGSTTSSSASSSADSLVSYGSSLSFPDTDDDPYSDDEDEGEPMSFGAPEGLSHVYSSVGAGSVGSGLELIVEEEEEEENSLGAEVEVDEGQEAMATPWLDDDAADDDYFSSPPCFTPDSAFSTPSFVSPPILLTATPSSPPLYLPPPFFIDLASLRSPLPSFTRSRNKLTPDPKSSLRWEAARNATYYGGKKFEVEVDWEMTDD